MKDGGRHLQAPVTLYAIKFLFVAASILNDAVVEPPAPLHSRVTAHQMILLPMQQVNYFVRNQRLQHIQSANMLEG
jgi:hypothetical protein